MKEYTFWRLKQILMNDYLLDLVPVAGYKHNRYRARKDYNLIDIRTNEIKVAGVELDTLRILFTEAGYPIHDDIYTREEQDI